MNRLRARPTSWIDPLPEQGPPAPAASWFVLGAVSVAAFAALVIAACALRVAGRALVPTARGHWQ